LFLQLIILNLRLDLYRLNQWVEITNAVVINQLSCFLFHYFRLTLIGSRLRVVALL